MTEKEEILKQIAIWDEIFSILPDEIIWRMVDVPKMLRDPDHPPQMILDPNTGKMKEDPKTIRWIQDPHERVTQRRNDLIDAKDKFKKTIIHFHSYPDNDAYEKNHEKMGNCVREIKPAWKFMKEELLKRL